MTSSWTLLSAQAPDLANVIRDRFGANLHHILGTIRPDGTVRLSGTEVTIGDDGIGVGMMPNSHKLHDVRRDPRVEIHSAPLEDDLATGDVKLSGTLLDVGATDGQPGVAFTLDISRASHVRVVGDELAFTTWTRQSGTNRQRRQ